MKNPSMCTVCEGSHACDIDQVEEGEEGLSPAALSHLRKRQAEAAHCSADQPSDAMPAARKRRAEREESSEQGKVPRVAHTQRVFLKSVSDMMGCFQVTCISKTSMC